jgi:DNA-binding MarR family transcriptional regulator
MSAAESRCLGVLAQFGVATAGQLATATGLTTGAITGIVDRLEKAGYARREPNPRDRRSVLIRPLPHPKLAEMLAPAYQKLRDAMTSVEADFTPAEMSVVARYLTQATSTLRTLTAELKAR